MKVTIIGPAYPLRGGIAHHVYWLQQELVARGHTVQVISFRKLYPGLFFPGTTEKDTSRLKLDAGAAPILTPLSLRTWLKAYKAVKAFGPEAVVFQWWQPFFGPVIGTLVRLFGKAGLKCIIECHNIYPHESSPLDLPLLKYAFSPAHYFITHSMKDRQDLEALIPGKKVSLAPLPALDEFSGSTSPARDGRRILFFGKVRKYKGLDVLLKAMPKVLARVECELIVAGEFYDSVDRYQQLIRELRIERSVRIEDRYVPNEEVPTLLERADVLVLPYVSATQSGVARIALSNALPIIASRTGGLSEVVIENVNGLLFPPGDVDALADQIISYFDNGLGPVFAKNILDSSRAGVKPELAEVIEEIVGRESTMPTPTYSR